MKKINLGSTNLQVSTIAAGCMRINKLEATELEAWVNTALENGIDFFDHADIYGRKDGGIGFCEKLFGDVLARNPGLRDRIFIQSKCGIRPGLYDFSAEHILKSVDDSLERLRCGYLDVLVLHRPDTLVEPEEVAAAFDRLYQNGKVRHFGVSNHGRSQIELLQKYTSHKLIVNQLQFGPAHTPMINSGLHVNMHCNAGIDRDGGVLEFCRMNDITIQTWSPLIYGAFEGIFLDNPKYAELNAALERIGGKYGLDPLGTVAAWILRHPAGMQLIFGSTQPARISAACRGAEIRLLREEWYEIYRAAGNNLP